MQGKRDSNVILPIITKSEQDFFFQKKLEKSPNSISKLKFTAPAGNAISNGNKDLRCLGRVFHFKFVRGAL